jgi:hypothetical protein
LAGQADPAIASLVEDLKARGLFKETVIIVGSEFGRTPMIQSAGQLRVNQGRDHNVLGFTTLLAGGGIRGGMTFGATDEFGLRAVENRVHPHDLQATVLHLLGLDHTRLDLPVFGPGFPVDRCGRTCGARAFGVALVGGPARSIFSCQRPIPDGWRWLIKTSGWRG